MPARTLKAAEKQTILKKLVTEMKRRYGGSVPKQSRSTFETLLFAICLENSSQARAEAAYRQLLESFFDLNEIRVSSVSEIEQALGDLEDSAWKAMRIREALQYTFEKHYAFDLEPLRRKTQDVALKELSQIPHQTSFVRLYTVQHSLGGHVLPVDSPMNHALMWLGLAQNAASTEETAEDLKSAVKKADGPLICHLLKCVVTDPDLREAFRKPPSARENPDPLEAPARLVHLFKHPPKKKAKAKKTAKAVSRKKPARGAAARTTASKTSKRATKKVTRKRPPPRKTPRRRSK